MKSRHKPRAKLSRTPVKALRNRRRVVKTLAAQGFSGDVIAAKLQLNKNHLRAEHALDLHAGREIKRAEKAAAEAAELSRKERERIEIITAAWNSDWYDAELGECLLFPDCKTLEEALEQSKKTWR
jgi:hypothetical protein